MSRQEYLLDGNEPLHSRMEQLYIDALQGDQESFDLLTFTDKIWGQHEHRRILSLFSRIRLLSSSFAENVMLTLFQTPVQLIVSVSTINKTYFRNTLEGKELTN